MDRLSISFYHCSVKTDIRQRSLFTYNCLDWAFPEKKSVSPVGDISGKYQVEEKASLDFQGGMPNFLSYSHEKIRGRAVVRAQN